MNSRRSGWKLMLPPPHGALAGPGFASHQQPFAGLDHHFCFTDTSGAVVEGHRKIVEAENSIAFDFAVLDAADTVATLGTFKSVERHHQRCGAARAGVPVRKPRVIVDQPTERALHDSEGGR